MELLNSLLTFLNSHFYGIHSGKLHCLLHVGLLTINLDSSWRYEPMFTCTALRECRLCLITWRFAVVLQQFHFGYQLSPRNL